MTSGRSRMHATISCQGGRRQEQGTEHHRGLHDASHDSIQRCVIKAASSLRTLALAPNAVPLAFWQRVQ